MKYRKFLILIYEEAMIEDCKRPIVYILIFIYIVSCTIHFSYIFNLCEFHIILSAYISLPWAADAPPPENELYVCLALLGTGLVLLPVFLSAAFLKLGNLANDGIKLGRHLSACSRDPPSALYINNADNSK